MVGISGAGLSLTDRGDPRIKAEVESLDAIHEFIACKITVSLDGFGSTLYSATWFQPYFLPSESHPCCCQRPQRPSKLLFLIDLNEKRSLTSPLPSREYDEANLTSIQIFGLFLLPLAPLISQGLTQSCGSPRLHHVFLRRSCRSCCGSSLYVRR